MLKVLFTLKVIESKSEGGKLNVVDQPHLEAGERRGVNKEGSTTKASCER